MRVVVSESEAKEALRKLVSDQGSLEAAAHYLGFESKSYISRLLNGKQRFSDNVLEKLGLSPERVIFAERDHA